MRRNSSEKIASLLFIVCCLFFYYHKFILSPNTYLTGAGGDGIMINATYAGHVKNDSTYTNFQNMNYPYGQTQIYTGGHPIFSNTLKFLSHYSSWFITHSIGFINILIILSYVGCAFFLCLILQKLRLPSLFVIFGSVGITLLSPQVFRWGGHPELSYAVFFPLSWYLFILFFESERKIFIASLIILNSIFWFFVCPYFIMLSTIFYGASYLVIVLQKKKFPINWKIVLLSFLQLALPLIVTRIYLALVDLHEFRSTHPYGLYVYYAKLNTVFAPLGPPFEHIFQTVFQMNDRHWEGWAYIGLPSVLLTLYSIFRLTRYVFHKNISLIISPAIPSMLQPAVYASILALIFSMCIPYRLNPEWFSNHLSFLAQFRSIGRFAWIFYYVFTVYGIYISYLLFRKLKMNRKRILGYAWCVFLFSCFYIESFSYHKYNASNIYGSTNYFNSNLLSPDYSEVIIQINQRHKDYQCIIPLPFYHVGSENFGKEFSDLIINSSMVISYWTNLPLLASSTARAPILEAKNVMQFFSPPFVKKEIEKDLPNKKPFLVLFDKEELTADERYWLRNSKKILENNTFWLGELSYEKVFHNTLEEEIRKFESIGPALINYNGLFVTSAPDTIVYSSFDSIASPHIFRGSGALKGIKKNYTDLMPKTRCFLKKDQDYVLGFWYYNQGELRNQISCILEELDEEGNNGSWNILIDPKETMKIDGDWSYVQRWFRIKPSTGYIHFFLKGDNHSSQEFYLDDFIVRPAMVNAYFTKQIQSENEKEEFRKSLFMIIDSSGLGQATAIRLNEIIKKIHLSTVWMQSIDEKAAARNISQDSMINLDARYMLEHEKR